MKNYSINNSFCKKCGLYKGAKTPCFIGSGNFNSKILVLADSPSKYEDDQKHTLLGFSGEFVKDSLSSLGLDYFYSYVK